MTAIEHITKTIRQAFGFVRDDGMQSGPLELTQPHAQLTIEAHGQLYGVAVWHRGPIEVPQPERAESLQTRGWER